MKLIENKGVAITSMVVLIIASTMVNGVMGINSLARKVNSEFVAGSENDGLSISRDLSTRATRAKNILSIAKNYIGESEADYISSLEYINILEQSEDKSELYEANQNLQASIDGVYAKCMEHDMTEKNSKSLKEEKSVFDNAMNTIGYDPYNTLVSEYEQKTDTIPGKVFKFFGTDVEYFK